MINKTTMFAFTGISKALVAKAPISIKLNVPLILARSFASSTFESKPTNAEYYKSALEKAGISYDTPQYTAETSWCTMHLTTTRTLTGNGIVYSVVERNLANERLLTLKEIPKRFPDEKSLMLDEEQYKQVDDILKTTPGEAREEMIFNLIMDVHHAGKTTLAYDLALTCLAKGPYRTIFLELNNLHFQMSIEHLIGGCKKQPEALSAKSITESVQEKARSLFNRLDELLRK